MTKEEKKLMEKDKEYYACEYCYKCMVDEFSCDNVDEDDDCLYCAKVLDLQSKINYLEKQLDKKDEEMSEVTTILFNIRSCFIFSDDKKRKVK